jgi:phytoene dehydrogenase-like protein
MITCNKPESLNFEKNIIIMKMITNDKSIIIIGAGFAGLAAGIYARLNGYKTQIMEMHDQPGGLCTAWKRKGYTFDCCIHWLVGSSQKSGLHDLWEETGVSKDREFIDMDEYCRMEDSDGRTLILYTNIDRLEKHLLEFSPRDERPIREFIQGIRICLPFDMPSKHDPPLIKIFKQIKTASNFIRNGRKMQYWMKTTCENFSHQFKDPLLKEAFRDMWIPEFSMFFMLFTFAYLHKRNAGYPIGGSMPLSRALEARFLDLGGIINYNNKVSNILTVNDKAVGIRLEDGTEYNADRVISAADGYTTLFTMLDGNYGDNKTYEPYEKWPLFPSLIFVSLGINRTFNDIPKTVSGISFHLKTPVLVGDSVRDKITIHTYNHDSTLAPEGKTAMTIMLDSDYAYWKKLAQDKKEYVREKELIGKKIIELLEQRFPGISELVEVTDIATPLTFERYTGNWKGTFEGWLITPENSNVLLKPMTQTIPGLKNFYMCGQWVEPGGGLPTAVMSAKRLLRMICKEDHTKFITDEDQKSIK